MTNLPSFAVMGAGATGALLAGRLAAAGLDVTLVARGDSLAAIRHDGIRIIGPDGKSTTVRPARVAAPGEKVPPADVSIFQVKSYDTVEAARALAPLVRDTGYVLCLQNGVENERVLARQVGDGRVLPGVLYVGAERLGPGVVACTTESRIVFGRGNADADAPVEAVEAAFRAAAIDVTVEPDILAAKWQKFIFNCGLNPLTALTGRRLGEILSSEDGRRLFSALVDEALNAVSADGAPVGPQTRERVMETAGRMDISSSMAEDLAAGRPLELEAFCGYVCRLSKTQGVSAPVTEACYRLLRVYNTLRKS